MPLLLDQGTAKTKGYILPKFRKFFPILNTITEYSYQKMLVIREMKHFNHPNSQTNILQAVFHAMFKISSTI